MLFRLRQVIEEEAPRMSPASVQYPYYERQAMAWTAASRLAGWGVSDVTAESLLDGVSGERTVRTAVLLGIHAALRQQVSVWRCQLGCVILAGGIRCQRASRVSKPVKAKFGRGTCLVLCYAARHE